MKLLDNSLQSPAENLACDEALLELFEERGGDGVLRFWEPQNYFVVVGYANEVAKEVDRTACEADKIPIFRRCSGGGTVLQGPGCLNYSLVMPITDGGPLHNITAANRFIMGRNRGAIEICRNRRDPARLFSKKKQRLLTSSPTVTVVGHTDLALTSGHSAHQSSFKFSGNAQRRKKHFLLFHGTFLLNFNILLIEKYLRMPSKEPGYRRNRSHKDFLMNLNLPAAEVKRALCDTWRAAQPLNVIPHDAIALLARDKYVTKEWNLKF